MTRRPVCMCALSSASWVSVGSAVAVVAFGDLFTVLCLTQGGGVDTVLDRAQPIPIRLHISVIRPQLSLVHPLAALEDLR